MHVFSNNLASNGASNRLDYYLFQIQGKWELFLYLRVALFLLCAYLATTKSQSQPCAHRTLLLGLARNIHLGFLHISSSEASCEILLPSI